MQQSNTNDHVLDRAHSLLKLETRLVADGTGAFIFYQDVERVKAAYTFTKEHVHASDFFVMSRKILMKRAKLQTPLLYLDEKPWRVALCDGCSG